MNREIRISVAYLLGTAGYAILFLVDWKIAMGVWLGIISSMLFAYN